LGRCHQLATLLMTSNLLDLVRLRFGSGCARVAARAVYLFHDHRCFRQSEPRAAIFFGNERRHPARFGECIDEGFGTGALLVSFAVILIWELGAKRANSVTDILKVI